MGNDGGSIPTRRELVKEAARNPTTTELKESQHTQQEYYWTTDPLSRKPLSPPIVSDSNGKLYNKDSIIEYLLPSDDNATKAEADTVLQGAVKSLKDVVEVKFDIDASAPKESNGWKCPITGDRLGPGSKAVYVVPCGHAFSAAAIKEVSGERCITCDEVYASNDVIPILPTVDTDIARLSLRTKTLKEKGLTHSLKKAAKDKKRKKRDEKDDTESPALVSAKAKENGNGNINNASTASLTAKVMQEQEAKKRKMQNDNLKGLFSSRDQSKPLGKSADFMTRGFDIPANAKR